MFRLLLILFLPLLTATIEASDTADYGYRIPNTPLYIGGYISMEYDKKEFDDIVFDDIALLFYGNSEKYHLLGEVEASDIALRGGKNSDIRFYIERLQITHDIDDYSSIRVGKFNSDIGFWNLAPINTLTDTSTSPYLMKTTFPELTTGILYSRSFGEEAQLLSITIQHNSDLDKRYNNMRINRHYALGWSYFGETYTWRLNGGYFHNQEQSDAFYAGVSYQKESEQWIIQSELFTKHTTNEKDVPYNLYLQLTRHIQFKHDFIFRQEFYKDDAIRTKEAISVIGYTYRPRPSVTLKSEYVRHSLLDKNRMVFSCSMVF